MAFRVAAIVTLLLAAAAPAAPPPLSATTLGGARFDLAEARGKVVIVHFWATWCAPCRIEMPVLDAYYRAHQGDGLEMLAVSVGRRRLAKEAARDDSKLCISDRADR